VGWDTPFPLCQFLFGVKIEMKFGKNLKNLLRKPGKKVDEIKMQAFSVGYNKIVSDYKSFRNHAVRAIDDMRFGVITPNSIEFFNKRILRYFFKKDEQGEGLAAKIRVENIVANWREKRLFKEDSDWLSEVFIPLLNQCEEKDLGDLVRIMKVEKIMGKVLDDGVDSS
jgi:hypothetical protein